MRASKHLALPWATKSSADGEAELPLGLHLVKILCLFGRGFLLYIPRGFEWVRCETKGLWRTYFFYSLY